jgi:hypothetical protein
LPGDNSGRSYGAEWIAEAPAGSAGIYPLSDFHRWAEASASITKGSRTGTISSFPDDQITMVDGSGRVKSQPSGLSNRGKNFTCTWKRSS